eukprot:TRINITY_DN14040_c0_g1_i2.p1 TRINITY_DN14040_c0_g1~~TRINITY_DN14040_c0_g1_i2.p1  ORF type:complete len:108 (+),score=28.91 TRINITY_DN14040_c0_g1_i2:90-413(+)
MCIRDRHILRPNAENEAKYGVSAFSVNNYSMEILKAIEYGFDSKVNSEKKMSVLRKFIIARREEKKAEDEKSAKDAEKEVESKERDSKVLCKESKSQAQYEYKKSDN